MIVERHRLHGSPRCAVAIATTSSASLSPPA
jgi:hypothetical protein